MSEVIFFKNKAYVIFIRTFVKQLRFPFQDHVASVINEYVLSFCYFIIYSLVVWMCFYKSLVILV